jgi:transposase-like protein
MSLSLEDLARQGAREMIQQAIEAEVEAFKASFAHVVTKEGHQAIVRNGYLPERDIQTAAGPLQAIWMAPTREEAERAFKHFVNVYGAKYPQPVEKLTKDEDALLAFYDFTAEHWQHIRTTNPVESTFATVRHRTRQTRNCVSRSTFLGLALKLMEAAEKTWRNINGADKISSLTKGIAFKDGVAVQDNLPQADQKLAA